MYFRRTIRQFTSNPKKLFLVDLIGAMLSAFLLVGVLARHENIFGIPPTSLYLLALFPVLFAIYDLFCLKIRTKKFSQYLKGIAIMNILYCFLSIGFALYHSKEITTLGWLYFVIEILLVTIIALTECNTAKTIERTKQTNTIM